MKATILDIYKEKSGSICYLTRSTLKEYVTSLKEDYNQYEVQREIVGHVYLDNLVTTLLNGKHIPPIVLIDKSTDTGQIGGQITLSDFKILDGLQRTYRLKYLYETILFFIEKDFDRDFKNKTRLQLSKEFKGVLFKINSNVGVLSKLIDYAQNNVNYLEDFRNLFQRTQWFEIWQGLTPNDEVNKMLILNAGHKAVSPKHQIELLFSYALPTLQKLSNNSDLSIIREKEKSSIRFSKERKKSQFHLSHLITGLLSYYEGKILTTNSDLIQTQQNNSDYAQDEVFLNSDLLKLFLETLLILDQRLITAFKDNGIKWLGREISLVGMFGALGKYRIKNEIGHEQAFEQLSKLIVKNPTILNIIGFEEERNSQALSKVNIGNVNKKAVFNATLDILDNKIKESVEWKNYFRGGHNDN